MVRPGYLLLGIWPLMALAERARQPLVAGGALAGATCLGGLVLLGQTRAIVPAVLLSVVFLLVAVPGRTRRAWALVVAAAGVGACIGPVLEVYDSVDGARTPGDPQLRDAALAILLASVGAGALWAAATAAVARLSDSKTRVLRFGWVPLVAVALRRGGSCRGDFRHPVNSVRDEYRAFTELGAQSDLHLALHERRWQPLRLLARGARPVRRQPDPGDWGRQL